jgi:hypothetical protein
MGKKWEKKAKNDIKWQKMIKKQKIGFKNYASVSTVLSIKTLPL